MYSRRRLLNDATLAVPSAAITASTISEVAGRQVAIPPELPLRYPRQSPAIDRLASALDNQMPPELHAGAARELLLNPARVYIRRSRPDRDVELVRAFTHDEGFTVVIARITLTEGQGRFAEPLAFDLQLEAISALDQLDERLERCYEETRSDRRRVLPGPRKAARLLWLGGSRHQSGVPESWVLQIESTAAVAGMTAEIIEDPVHHFEASRNRVANANADVVVVWAPFVPGQPALLGGTTARIMAIDEAEFPDARLMLRLELGSLLDHLPDEGPVDAPTDWPAFTSLLRHDLVSDAFVVAPHAYDVLGGNPYPDPSRMWQFLSALARAAEAYREAEADLGTRFEDWVRARFGIEVAMHDARLGEASFDYDGAQYSYAPHVKVDEARARSETGRIYFAIDPVNLRFIVYHVGAHL